MPWFNSTDGILLASRFHVLLVGPSRHLVSPCHSQTKTVEIEHIVISRSHPRMIRNECGRLNGVTCFNPH